MSTDYDRSDEIKNFYNAQAKANPSSAGVLAVNTRIEQHYREVEEWKHFQRFVDLNPYLNLLELGCGAGRWCRDIAPRTAWVHGIDISDEAITLARRMALDQKLENVSFEVCDIRHFNVDRKYEIVYFSGVLLYIDDVDLRRVIQSYTKLVSDGGLVVVRDTCMTQSRREFEYPYGSQYGSCPVIYRNREEYVQVFAEYGYHLAYCAPTYLHVCPSVLPTISIIEALYVRFPKFTLKLIKKVSQICASLRFGESKHENNFSHEFQVYTLQKQR